MKKLLNFALLTVLLCSCGPESREEVTYQSTILNRSGQTVLLTLFVNDIRDPASTRTLKNNEEIKKILTVYPPGGNIPMWSLLNSNLSGVITKFEIVFNNEKKITYEKCDVCNNPRNIFDLSYIDELVETYTITPEDFQNAADCGGNCY